MKRKRMRIILFLMIIMINSDILKNYNEFIKQFNSLDLSQFEHQQIIIPCKFKASEKDVFYINNAIIKQGFKILYIKYSEEHNCSFFKLTHLEKNNLSRDDIIDYFNF